MIGLRRNAEGALIGLDHLSEDIWEELPLQFELPCDGSVRTDEVDAPWVLWGVHVVAPPEVLKLGYLYIQTPKCTQRVPFSRCTLPGGALIEPRPIMLEVHSQLRVSFIGWAKMPTAAAHARAFITLYGLGRRTDG